MSKAVEYRSFEGILREILGDFADLNNCDMFGNLAVMKLKKGKVAHISLWKHGTPVADKYTTLLVKIKHKDDGDITVHNFPFDEHMDNSMRGRRDDRPDYKNNYYIWKNGTIAWYIAVPTRKEMDKLVKKVEKFIELHN